MILNPSEHHIFHARKYGMFYFSTHHLSLDNLTDLTDQQNRIHVVRGFVATLQGLGYGTSPQRTTTEFLIKQVTMQNIADLTAVQL